LGQFIAFVHGAFLLGESTDAFILDVRLHDGGGRGYTIVHTFCR